MTMAYRTHRFTIPTRTSAPVEAHIMVEPNHARTMVYGLVFDDDAATILDIPSRGYVDYCDAEVCYMILADELAGIRGIECADISLAIDAVLGECECC